MEEPKLETVELSLKGRVARITLNQPDRLNPLGIVTLRELIEAARWVDGQRSVTVAVISATGSRAFSSGFDLEDFTAAAADPDAETGAILGARMANAIEAMQAVTVAAIFGHCIGGGVVLAASCDMRFAADDTRFAIPELDLGIPLAWGGIPRLVREIGPAATRELVLTCRRFDAHEAQRLGLVNRVVPRSDLAGLVDELAAGIAQKAPIVVRSTKRQVADATDAMVSTRHGWIGEPLLLAALADPDARKATARYLEGLGSAPAAATPFV